MEMGTVTEMGDELPLRGSIGQENMYVNILETVRGQPVREGS